MRQEAEGAERGDSAVSRGVSERAPVARDGDSEVKGHLEPDEAADVRHGEVDRGEAAIDDAVEMTFPASDPPSWTPGHAG